LVSANKKAAIGKPGVASVVFGDVGLHLINGCMHRLENIIILNLIKFISVIAGYEDCAWVLVVEGTLCNR